MRPLFLALVALALALGSCTAAGPPNEPAMIPGQEGSTPIRSEFMGVAYSGFREGQHPDRGDGAVNPSRAETLEDLNLLVARGFRLIRLYDSGENSAIVLQVIEAHQLPIRVMLGMWLEAEVSNHAGCAWLNEPIPAEVLKAHRSTNADEVARGIALAQQYPEIVMAISVGNEALVEWNDDMVPLASVLEYVRRVKAEASQPVTVADNYRWWIEHGARLAGELDFIGVHTYPVWEGKGIDEALDYTIENIEEVRAALPGVPLTILEAGWATTAVEFGERASEAHQARYFWELEHWAAANRTAVFFFEAFDEPWKGDPNNAQGAEKHWGLWSLDRAPKAAIRD